MAPCYRTDPLMSDVIFKSMFDNSDEEQQPCVMCGQQHQQMLMLSCVHDPCINCAALHYVENQPRNSKIYHCAKCGQQTELDTSSVMELQRVYNTLKARRKSDANRIASNHSHRQEEEYRQPRVKPYDTKNSRQEEYEHPPFVSPSPNASKYYPPAPVSQPSFSNPKKTYQLQYPCPDHPDEELTYFCFTCNNPICPECAIHGLHKDHEVQTTRKAIKQIRGMLAEDKVKLDQAAAALLDGRDKGKKQTKEWGEEGRRDQEYIKKKLAHLRSLLAEKEKELLKSSEANFDRNCDLLREQASWTDKALEDIAGSKRNIDSTLKKEELVILQEFNKRDEEANDLLDRVERQREKTYDLEAKNPHRVVDFNRFDDEVDRILADLQALKLTTTPK